ncbi:hypothetical protein SYNPS1DRAFT_31823 [Syncephalis pseudoplumigaleata]|uniref:DUSP domain-containing protein n=1 Tax=Syncephalis pseudoplumigaleata TaxID=1712513 RepID=A0A4P9YSD1_9FUNG|nr:hypothetical protein SYNPS1DRAFT_31823 [Syncephalis pseudoplumigaleata]|eukprot:RKP22568.1 hypothetical protein SYNPS1DRAFT_31823 [Syncephalis pseudoplumigaleata]
MPHVLCRSMDVYGTAMFCTRKWLGGTRGPRDEHEFVVDWQRRLLLALADLPCCRDPTAADASNALPCSPRGYPLPPPHHLWHPVTWNERRQWEREIPYVLDSTPFCFVAVSWMQAWNEFLLGNAPPPGPIDNSSLLEPVHTYDEQGVPHITHALAQHVRPDIDFWIVSTGEWTTIEQCYGGGPHLSESNLDATKHMDLITHMRHLRESVPAWNDVHVATLADMFFYYFCRQIEQGSLMQPNDDDSEEEEEEEEDEEHPHDSDVDDDEEDDDDDDLDSDDDDDDDDENDMAMELVMIL